MAVGDLDGDGWPDIYVANDATPNQLWINRHDGTFEDRGLLSGTAFNALGRPEGSMGIALGDADNDGDEDLFVTNIIGESHVLYLNDGAATSRTRARDRVWRRHGGHDRLRHGWIDYDNDGRLDLFVTNGAVQKSLHMCQSTATTGRFGRLRSSCRQGRKRCRPPYQPMLAIGRW